MRRWKGFTWAWLPLVATLAWSQQGGDMQARILYAYQAEDTNQLASLKQDLANQVNAGGADTALRYHLAHAQYRFGLLAEGKRDRDAAPAFEGCIEQLKPVLSQDVKSVEALVLQSACYGELAKRRRLEAVLLRSKADERLASAYALDPHNPRVLFFMAQMVSLMRSRAARRASARSRSCRSPPGFSISPRPRATTCRAGGTPKPTLP